MQFINKGDLNQFAEKVQFQEVEQYINSDQRITEYNHYKERAAREKQDNQQFEVISRKLLKSLELVNSEIYFDIKLKSIDIPKLPRF